MDDEICRLCGQAGADKIPQQIHWPGAERGQYDGEYVHRVCEDQENMRAHALLTEEQRARFLRSL